MNIYIFNDDPGNLSMTTYGTDNQGILRPFNLAIDGIIILSPTNSSEITSDNVDIRPLSPLKDTARILADNLNIRPLNVNQDSMTVYNNSFVEAPQNLEQL